MVTATWPLALRFEARSCLFFRVPVASWLPLIECRHRPRKRRGKVNGGKCGYGVSAAICEYVENIHCRAISLPSRESAPTVVRDLLIWNISELFNY